MKKWLWRYKRRRAVRKSSMKSISLISGYIIFNFCNYYRYCCKWLFKNYRRIYKTKPNNFLYYKLIVICIFCISKAMTVIPVGFTYATYGALTITAVTLFGIFKYNQTPNVFGSNWISLNYT